MSAPNEALIFSGRPRRVGDREVGYRVVRGGRALRVPLFEVVDSVDLTNIAIDIQVRGAYSKGGIPLNVHGVANIKLPGEELLVLLGGAGDGGFARTAISANEQIKARWRSPRMTSAAFPGAALHRRGGTPPAPDSSVPPRPRRGR